MADRNTYARFCEQASDLPVFMQPWYLDAVCTGGHWEVALVEKGGRIVAALPYFLKKKWGRQYVAMPPLARMMGPYLLPEFRRTRKEFSLLEALIDQLPARLAAYEQDFHYSAQNWLPFYWRGFRQTTRYSYLLETADLDAVWKNLAPDYRNQKIPKAQEATEVRTGLALPEFLKAHNRSYERQGLRAPVASALLQRLDEALAGHGQREILYAADRETGAIHSVAYLVWDRHSAYYLMAGDEPALRQSGAGILVAWEAIRYTRNVLQLPVFDFAGSMVQSIERVRRQFGAVQQPYFRVQKEWSPVWKVGNCKAQMTAKIVIAVPCFSGGNASSSTPWLEGCNPPPASPCSTRAAMSTSKFVAIPQRADAIVNTAIDSRK